MADEKVKVVTTLPLRFLDKDFRRYASKKGLNLARYQDGLLRYRPARIAWEAWVARSALANTVEGVVIFNEALQMAMEIAYARGHKDVAAAIQRLKRQTEDGAKH